jgi:thymidylate kinase
MLILIEGPRGAGKSHLVDHFFKENTDPSFIYYKFEFSNWLNILDLAKIDPGPEVHYFSVSNIITIFDVATNILKGKTIIMDRSILSAYVWSIYRNRVDKEKLVEELNSIMRHQTFKDCKIVYVNRDNNIQEVNRGKKDMFDEFENYDKELNIYNNLISDMQIKVNFFNNTFNSKSQEDFNHLLISLSNK